MAAFAAILDDKLGLPPETTWSWRPAPVTVFPFAPVNDRRSAAAYGASALPAQRHPSRPSARPPRRTLTGVQAAALAILRQLGASELDDTSTDDEVRYAYRRLAQRWHPDRLGGTADATPFRTLHAAYLALSNRS